MERYKTIHENAVLINPPSVVEKMKEPQLLNNLLIAINQLHRFETYYDHEGAFMREDSDGEYIKLEDVLTLFRAKKL